MQFRLRTLMIVLALVPPAIGWCLSPTGSTPYELVEGLVCRLTVFYVLGIIAFAFWDWRRNVPPHHC